jgi:hypothetical protein
MTSGTSFDRPYVPDEAKQIIGPIEDNIDESSMNKAILGAAMFVSVVGGIVCFIGAILVRVW